MDINLFALISVLFISAYVDASHLNNLQAPNQTDTGNEINANVPQAGPQAQTNQILPGAPAQPAGPRRAGPRPGQPTGQPLQPGLPQGGGQQLGQQRQVFRSAQPNGQQAQPGLSQGAGQQLGQQRSIGTPSVQPNGQQRQTGLTQGTNQQIGQQRTIDVARTQLPRQAGPARGTPRLIGFLIPRRDGRPQLQLMPGAERFLMGNSRILTVPTTGLRGAGASSTLPINLRQILDAARRARIVPEANTQGASNAGGSGNRRNPTIIVIQPPRRGMQGNGQTGNQGNGQINPGNGQINQGNGQINQGNGQIPVDRRGAGATIGAGASVVGGGTRATGSAGGRQGSSSGTIIRAGGGTGATIIQGRGGGSRQTFSGGQRNGGSVIRATGGAGATVVRGSSGSVVTSGGGGGGSTIAGGGQSGSQSGSSVVTSGRGGAATVVQGGGGSFPQSGSNMFGRTGSSGPGVIRSSGGGGATIIQGGGGASRQPGSGAAVVHSGAGGAATVVQQGGSFGQPGNNVVSSGQGGAATVIQGRPNAGPQQPSNAVTRFQPFPGQGHAQPGQQGQLSPNDLQVQVQPLPQNAQMGAQDFPGSARMFTDIGMNQGGGPNNFDPMPGQGSLRIQSQPGGPGNAFPSLGQSNVPPVVITRAVDSGADMPTNAGGSGMSGTQASLLQDMGIGITKEQIQSAILSNIIGEHGQQGSSMPGQLPTGSNMQNIQEGLAAGLGVPGAFPVLESGQSTGAFDPGMSLPLQTPVDVPPIGPTQPDLFMTAQPGFPSATLHNQPILSGMPTDLSQLNPDPLAHQPIVPSGVQLPDIPPEVPTVLMRNEGSNLHPGQDILSQLAAAFPPDVQTGANAQHALTMDSPANTARFVEVPFNLNPTMIAAGHTAGGIPVFQPEWNAAPGSSTRLSGH